METRLEIQKVRNDAAGLRFLLQCV